MKSVTVDSVPFTQQICQESILKFISHMQVHYIRSCKSTASVCRQNSIQTVTETSPAQDKGSRRSTVQNKVKPVHTQPRTHSLFPFRLWTRKQGLVTLGGQTFTSPSTKQCNTSYVDCRIVHVIVTADQHSTAVNGTFLFKVNAYKRTQFQCRQWRAGMVQCRLLRLTFQSCILIQEAYYSCSHHLTAV